MRAMKKTTEIESLLVDEFHSHIILYLYQSQRKFIRYASFVVAWNESLLKQLRSVHQRLVDSTAYRTNAQGKCENEYERKGKGKMAAPKNGYCEGVNRKKAGDGSGTSASGVQDGC
jgi:hypothetical protein